MFSGELEMFQTKKFIDRVTYTDFKVTNFEYSLKLIQCRLF